MANLISLHNNLHKQMTVCPETAEAHGAKLTMVPVMLSEFLKLAVQYPIALTKNKETGVFVCVSMFGFSEGENLFWQDGQWDTLYTPLHIARQPFFLGKNNDAKTASDEEQYVVCFDADSDSLRKAGGEALFDTAGNETAYLQRMKSLLAELLDGEAKTQVFVDKLVALDLLQPMRLDISFVNGDSHRVNGMYTVDEEKLSNLPEEIIVELHASGYLSYIYAMIVSMGQIYSLVQRKNARLSANGVSKLESVSA